MKHLNDEHMQLYEWSGAGSGIIFGMPAKSRRTHPWHASYAVLAVLTSLLILNGCDSDTATELTSEQAAREEEEDKAAPSDAMVAQPVPDEAAAPAAGGEAGDVKQDAQQP
jgi:hypothetical protein